MFYSNNTFITRAQDIINETDKLIVAVSQNKDRGKIESELKFTMILKSTGNIELYFDDIMKEFANLNSSPIFHRYFHNNFTKAGKNVNPEKINNLLNALNIPAVAKNANPQAWTALDSLYNLRNSLAHGDTNIVETYSNIKQYISDSMVFMQLLIQTLDNVSTPQTN